MRQGRVWERADERDRDGYVKIGPFVATLAANPTFVSPLCAWAAAQSMKVFLNFCVERTWDFRIMFSCGGMPSSHSALCTALTASVAICHDVADSLFPIEFPAIQEGLV